ncbi:MAG: ABC transporter permease [Anaerolineaceae bacterium]|nr:ABC transporter permease [Anaerolineaceae bacterium]
MNMQLTLALRYLSGRKLRTFLTILAIMFGVMVVFGMNMVLPNIVQAMQTNILATEGEVDLSISHVTGNPFDKNILQQVVTVNGVRAVNGSLNHVINIPEDYYDQDKSKADQVSALNLIGIDPNMANTVHAYPLSDGRFLTQEDHNAVVITESLANQMGVKLGDTISIPGNTGEQHMEIVGILFPRLIPGNEEILVPLTDAQMILNTGDKINVIEVNLRVDTDESFREEIRNEIISQLGDDYRTGILSNGEAYMAIAQMGQIIMNLFGALALFTGAFIIYNTFRTIILERRHDIGLLRAIGASRKMILQLIVIEGAVLGLVGSVIGILLGYLLGKIIVLGAQIPMQAFLNISIDNVTISPLLVVISLALGVGISILSGLIPAIKASRISPMDALRPTLAEVDYHKQKGGIFFIGLVFGAIALLFLFSKVTALLGVGAFLFLIAIACITPTIIYPLSKGFGMVLTWLFHHQGTSEIAKGNLIRNASRSSITVSATMICLAVVVGAAGFVSSMGSSLSEQLRGSFRSDYLFIPPSISLWSNNVGANQRFVESLQSIEGVGLISTLRFADSQVDENGATIIGIDPDAFPIVSTLDFSEGDESTYQKMKTGRYMVVNSTFATSTGYQVGDVVELASVNGGQSYEIVAIGGDIMNAKVIGAYVAQENLARDFDTSDDFFIQLNLAEGANVERVHEQIIEIAAGYPQFTVIRSKEFVSSFINQMNAAFIGLYFLLALLALPSLIAMLNTLAISVIERTREIGMLRAVGATRQQIRNMIKQEAVLLALIGTTFGIVSGLYLGLVFVDVTKQLMTVVYKFPISGVIAAVVIGLAFGVLAAVIPAKQASKLNVVEALRYE